MTTSVIVRRMWTTAVSGADLSAQQLKVAPGHGAAQLPLISSTGFEQRHIVTSQIGSL